MRCCALVFGALAALAVFAPPLQAQTSRPANGASTLGRRAARAGDLRVLQVATTDPQRFISDWEKPGPHVDLVTAASTKPEQPITTFLLFTGCKGDRTGHCNLTTQFAVYNEAGKAVLRTKDNSAWRDAPPQADVLYLATANATVGFRKSDPVGPYRIEATTVDQVAGVTARTEQVVAVQP